MKYTCYIGEKFYEADDIRSLMLGLEIKDLANAMTLVINLPIDLEAKLRRRRRGLEGLREEIWLTGGRASHTRMCLRKTDDHPEHELGVSCSPNGFEVPVDSINLPFRNIDDILTDRGLVWVKPGRPATAMLIVNLVQFKNLGGVVKIVEEAENVVEEKVLSHFQQNVSCN
ncbi:MAG TPA: hypothetical protein VJC12_02415 [Candidatus Paceibacterota bacterium]